MRLLLVTAPLTQLNTPYPATAFLTGLLRQRGLSVVQADPGLAWVLRLLSPESLERITYVLKQGDPAIRRQPAVRHFLANADGIIRRAGPVLSFLQNRDLSLAHRIAGRGYLVEGPSFANMGPEGEKEQYLDWAFGQLGVVDRARYLATLFLEDVVAAIQTGIDPAFGFSRYGESLAHSATLLDPFLAELDERDRWTTHLLAEITRELVAQHAPQVIGISVPFPGNVLGALRLAQTVRELEPGIKIVWGGGFVSTELRRMSDSRLFAYVDALVYDEGEMPLAGLLDYFAAPTRSEPPAQTRMLVDGVVTDLRPAPGRAAALAPATPTYDGLALADYLAMIDMANPMHRLWTDTRWNKLVVARGCYWKKCAFCDVTLPYIAHYQPNSAEILVDQIEHLIGETGQRGFHFVDEAAPPAALRTLAQEIFRRGVQISWWANIRFEKAFDHDMCQLLARSGCIAVTGGIEAAHNRLLRLMNKGVTLAQAARVTKAFADSGVRVHAYLIYGFPSETVQETIDSLEYVRQLFVAGCLDSAFWHRFALTVHSPIARHPERFGIRIHAKEPAPFAQNEIGFDDATGVDHARLGPGLKKAVYNYMLGLGLEQDVRVWFAGRVPKTKVEPTFIRSCLSRSS